MKAHYYEIRHLPAMYHSESTMNITGTQQTTENMATLGCVRSL